MRQNSILLVSCCFILSLPPSTRARSHLSAPEPVYRPGGHYISTSTKPPPKKALENELGAQPIDEAGLKEEIQINSGVKPELATEATTKTETEMEWEPKPVSEEIQKVENEVNSGTKPELVMELVTKTETEMEVKPIPIDKDGIKEDNEINSSIKPELEMEATTKLETVIDLVTKQIELTVSKPVESPHTETQSTSTVTQQPHTTKPAPPLREDTTGNKVTKLPRPPRTPLPPPPSSETQIYATSTTKATTLKVLKLPTPPRTPLPPPPKQLLYRTSTNYLRLLFAQKQIEFIEVLDRDANLYQWREYT